MQKVKTSKVLRIGKLTGAALDWAVQQCEGARKDIDFVWWTDDHYSPSTDWAQGGPIIERERISTQTTENCWDADLTTESGVFIQAVGHTPLIAAMRCYVASKLGDTVEVPEELTQ